MTIIIGIDPGSRITGYGLIQIQGNQINYLDSGSIKVADEPQQSQRLQKIFFCLQNIINSHQPQEAAIEQVFMHENPGAALKLGQARGAAIVSLKIPVAEYSARQVKQSVVGYGAAKKEQVQQMVKYLLNLQKKIQADEGDALAIALCHAHTRFTLGKTHLITKPRYRNRKSTWRNYIVET